MFEVFQVYMRVVTLGMIPLIKFKIKCKVLDNERKLKLKIMNEVEWVYT